MDSVYRPGLRALLLLRKSNKPGENNVSMAMQRQHGLTYIRQQGWTCNPSTDVVEQVVSGWSLAANRSKIAELVDSTLTGAYDVIVMYKIDRFGRRVAEVSTYFDQMAANGVLLASTVEGLFDLALPFQMFMAISAVNAAQLESGNTSTRVRGGRGHRREQGHWQGGTPYGWELDCTTAPSGDRLYHRAANNSKRLRRAEGERDVVDRILHLARTEMRNPGAIAKILNAAGQTTRAGNPWSDKSVRRLLVNPVLAGCIAEWDYDPTTRRPLAWSVHPLLDGTGRPVLVHEPALSLTEYQALYAQHGPRTVSTRDRAGRALLTGLLRCASGPVDCSPDYTDICGGRLTGSGAPGPRHKYHCPHDDEPLRCRGNTITQHAVESFVVTLFIALVASGDFAAQHGRLVAEATASAGGEHDELQREIAALTDLAQAHRDAAAAATTAQVARESTANYDRTWAKLEELQRRAMPSAVRPAPLDGFPALDEAACRAMFLAANRDQQRAWLATVFSFIDVLPANGRGTIPGRFGAVGLDPRRLRLHLRHDPAHPIVTPQDWQPEADSNGEPVVCPECRQPQKNQAGLASHLRHKHGRVSPARRAARHTPKTFSCALPGCKQVLPNEAGLRIHLWHAHQQTQGYPCPQDGCGKVYALPAHVARHLATTHSSEREFCGLCGQSFRKNGLWLHQKRAHS